MLIPHIPFRLSVSPMNINKTCVDKLNMKNFNYKTML